jgi:hypothetical protein
MKAAVWGAFICVATAFTQVSALTATRKRVLIGLGVLAFLVVPPLAYVIYQVTHAPPIEGGMSIAAPPDARIYVGEKQCRTGDAFLTWTELLGFGGAPPLAIELKPRNGPFQVEELDLTGARFLTKVDGSATVLGLSGHQFQLANHQLWLRRADAALDPVQVLLLDWTPPDGPKRRFAVLIRVRVGSGNQTGYLPGGFSSGGMGSGFGAAPELHINWTFNAASQPPPQDLAAEVAEKGVWDPSRASGQ